MPRFTPTDQQRHLVTLCAGGMSQHEIARSENSVLFGMRAVIGFDDRNPPVTMRLGVSGPDGKSSTINIEFVQPDPSRFRDDDEPARLPAPPRDITPQPAP
jgi:hypothetical protein